MSLIDQIANELIIASQIEHTNEVSKLAEKLGYQPILIMNALYAGEKTGKFKFIAKKDIIKIDGDVTVADLAVTDGLSDSREQVELFIANLNDLEKDIWVDELHHSFIPGLAELHLKIAIYTSPKLTTYELSDPKDKESKYEFVTLVENADKQFGKKQFDYSKKKKNGSK